MFLNLFDSHTHSQNSLDGEHPVTLMVETAISKGLQGMAITDHCECDDFGESNRESLILQSEIDTTKAKYAFGKNFVLTFGLEVGQPFFNIKMIEKILQRHRFDFVLGSIHKLRYDDFEYYEVDDYTNFSADKLHEYNLKYFEEIIELIKWGKFDVVSHLTFLKRYPKLRGNVEIDLNRYKELIDEVLRLTVNSGKGLELNTSGLRNGQNETMPTEWIVKRFFELGGELCTIGSDAHRAEDVGEGINQAMEMLSRIGYKYFAFYRERKPVMLRII